MILQLVDNTILPGKSFGANKATDGEVVFCTGMVGYPEALTDPSYRGQILTFTYPLMGNYGVSKGPFESDRIQVSGIIVSEYCDAYSHPAAKQSLREWLRKEKIPALEGVDTRALTEKLRENGTMLGRITKDTAQPFEVEDPNERNLVAEVSCKKPVTYSSKKKAKHTILLYDCGVKLNIIHSLVERGCTVKRVPWDYEIGTDHGTDQFDGIVISNGPGDPTKCDKTIEQISSLITSGTQMPILGICLGNQILSLAIGAKTYKLKYGHRSQNQPVMDAKTNKAYVTTQNHGFAVRDKTIPKGWEVWFTNLNDGTVEGIRHKIKPWISVQFHPEATPGPVDTAWIFDTWLSKIK